MKNNSYILILIAVILSACQNRIVPKPDKKGACIREYGVLINELLSNDVDSVNLADSLYGYMFLLKNGSVRKTNSNDFIERVCSLTNDTILRYPLPYLTVKETENVVLFTNGKGMWGEVYTYILFDIKERKILRVKCASESEAPVTDISFNDTVYSNRYVNIKMESTSTKIDGLSGATVTSKAFEKSIIEGIKKYEKIWL